MYDQTLDDLVRQLNNGLDIYVYYMSRDPRYAGKEIKPKKKYLSPLRDEKHGSFEIYWNNNKNSWWFSDFNHKGAASCWDFVMELYGIEFKEALAMVKQDLLGYLGGVQNVAYIRQTYAAQHTAVNEKILFTPQQRNLSHLDMALWNQFLIYPETLHLFHTFPAISYDIQKNNKSFRIFDGPNDPIYFINFPVVNRQKIYRPLTTNPKFKWSSNTIGEEDIFGFDIAPRKADKGFVVSGNKDTMSFFSLMQAYNRYPVIAFNSETFKPSMEIMMILFQISPNWYSVYDHEPDKKKNTGLEMSQWLEGERGIKQMNYPVQNSGCKDWSLMVKHLLQSREYNALKDIKTFYDQLP